MSNENRSISLLLTLKGVRTNESSLTEGRCANIQVILGFSYARDMVETPLLHMCGYYSVFCKRFFFIVDALLICQVLPHWILLVPIETEVYASGAKTILL